MHGSKVHQGQLNQEMQSQILDLERPHAEITGWMEQRKYHHTPAPFLRASPWHLLSTTVGESIK